MLPRRFGLWCSFDQNVFSVARRHALSGKSTACRSSANLSTDTANSDGTKTLSSGSSDEKSSGETGIDIERVFMRNDVQNLLQRTTKADANVVYARPRRRLLGRYPTNMEESKLKAVTENELEELTKKHAEKMRYRLQIPPIMQERKPCEELITTDELLAAYDDHKHVFVDITYGVNPRKRKMVIRETDGKLRTASWDERDRLLQIYVPLEGRSVDVPKLFEPDNLKAALQQQQYRMVLDRACLQLEPDSPEYIRICHQTYDSVDARAAYAALQSTRHNAGLLFYLALHKRIDKYLNWCLREQLVQAAIHVVGLYDLIHNSDQNESRSGIMAVNLGNGAESLEADNDIESGITAIEAYLENESKGNETLRENSMSALRRLTNNARAGEQAQ